MDDGTPEEEGRWSSLSQPFPSNRAAPVEHGGSHHHLSAAPAYAYHVPAHVRLEIRDKYISSQTPADRLLFNPRTLGVVDRLRAFQRGMPDHQSSVGRTTDAPTNRASTATPFDKHSSSHLASHVSSSNSVLSVNPTATPSAADAAAAQLPPPSASVAGPWRLRPHLASFGV